MNEYEALVECTDMGKLSVLGEKGVPELLCPQKIAYPRRLFWD
jgi:hypothetical protein